MNRDERARIARETMAAVEAGFYTNQAGRRVDIGDPVRRSVGATRVIRPEEWDAIVVQARRAPRATGSRLEVTDETTLSAIQRVVREHGRGRVAALNFASARNPGGGFLSGAQAQEESLARASALYPTLLAGSEYYRANGASDSPFYSDHAILSPDVPVIRTDDGAFLEEPHLVTFITMPAVNRGRLIDAPADDLMVGPTMARRIEQVLALTVVAECRAVVLGAWGCGVFRNDPAQIADLFATALYGERQWAAWFERIVFAVYDNKPDRSIVGAFRAALAAPAAPEGRS